MGGGWPRWSRRNGGEINRPQLYNVRLVAQTNSGDIGAGVGSLEQSSKRYIRAPLRDTNALGDLNRSLSLSRSLFATHITRVRVIIMFAKLACISGCSSS